MTKKQLHDVVKKIHDLGPAFMVVALPFGSAAVIFGCYRGHSFAVLWGRQDEPNEEAHAYMAAAEASGCSVLAAETFNSVVGAVKAVATAVNVRYDAVKKDRTWNLINSNGNQTGH